MSRLASVRSLLPCPVRLTAVPIALFLLPISIGANPVPDAMVYFNVRPAGPPEDLCGTEITHCREMIPSTESRGLLEFQIFIDPQQTWNGAVPVRYFVVDLSWPESWTFVDGRPCLDALGWSIDLSGPNPHLVEVAWPCTVPDGLFLALTLVFDVQGYGILDTSGECTLWLDCPSYPVYPTANYAEAGTECEYTNQPCARWSFRCVPEVGGMQLPMSAPEGGMAHGELEFTISGYPYPRCDFTANSSEPWATGYVISNVNLQDAVLYVDADASGLEPGVHETEMQIVYDGTYDGAPVQNARCLPVILTVEPATAVHDQPWPQAPPAPQHLDLEGPNPSSGPFIFTYEIPTTCHVGCGVHDASGREVASLLDEVQSGGRHRVTWNAVDAAGRPVRPGVYMVRLNVDAEIRTGRVVVVR